VRFDLEDASSFESALDASRPEAVVHAAALAEPDVCEREPARAQVCNADAPARLARLARARGLRLIALSTDLVFAGDRAPYAEDDAPAPLQAYGRTKLAGERAALAEDPGAVVLRLPLMVGRGHGRRATATESVAWALRDGRPVRLFTDQVRTPLDAASVADAIERVLAASHAGTFHLGGDERLSRYDLGRRVADALGLPAALITPVRHGERPQAPRPADASLASLRAREVLGWRPRRLDDAIRDGRRTAV
jgi:dTDP-4-dehydrorhamnose reductase